MDQAALKELTSYPVLQFKKGEKLLSTADEQHYVYYLAEGRCMRQATTSAGEELFFEDYAASDSVYALVGPYMNFASSEMVINTELVALTSVRAHQISDDEFDAFLERHPKVMRELLQRIVDEYTLLMNNFIAKQKGQAAPRVASFIIERAEKINDRYIFSRFCSVSDIARFLGMHRITANKIILALRGAGCIAYNNNTIEITDMEMLMDFANGNRKIDYKK